MTAAVVVDIAALAERTYAFSLRRGRGAATFAEIAVHAHSEVTEAYEEWLRRYETASVVNVADVQQHMTISNNVKLPAEWTWRSDGKPEGLAAELADVVLTCSVMCRKSDDPVPTEYVPQQRVYGTGSVIELFGYAHEAIARWRPLVAIDVAFEIAKRLQFDLEAAIMRKADHNDCRLAWEGKSL